MKIKKRIKLPRKKASGPKKLKDLLLEDIENDDFEDLLPRQRLFIKNYVKNFYNGKLAAIESGYSENTAALTACNLLKRKDIQDLVQKEIDKRNDKIEIDQQKVLKDLEELRKKCFYGNKVATAAKCSELQGKSIQLFTDKTVIGIDQDTISRFEESQRNCYESLKRLVPAYNKERFEISYRPKKVDEDEVDELRHQKTKKQEKKYNRI